MSDGAAVGLVRRLTTLLQCFHPAGWVIRFRPVKILSPKLRYDTIRRYE